MEIFNQLPTFAVIIQYITDGFFLGALLGAVIGASVWTLMERGMFSVWPLVITAGLGVFVGIYLEGDVLRTLANRDWTTFFSGPLSFRTSVFNAVLSIFGWTLGVMVIGAIIANYRLAILGFIIGGLMGTLSGILVQVMGTELGFPVDSPITGAVVTIIAALLMVLTAAGREKEIR